MGESSHAANVLREGSNSWLSPFRRHQPGRGITTERIRRRESLQAPLPSNVVTITIQCWANTMLNTVQDGPFGPYSKSPGWVPAPRYLLRRHRVLRLMQDLPGGQLLEIGCGSGALLRELSGLGHRCWATEHSTAAYDLAVKLNADRPETKIFREIDPSWTSKFDYVLAFEVLEHIEDDVGALRHWRSLLKPNGYVLLSVPAHQRKWSATDVGAGHFRRYERRSLTDALRAAGLEICELEIYGFPLANLIQPLQSMRYRRKLATAQLRAAEDASSRLSNTAHSGVDRSLECKLYSLYATYPGAAAMNCMCSVQAWFRRTELGNGYLALAQRTDPAC